MNKDSFAGYHPVVNLLYFIVVIGFTMFILHPVFLVISLLGAVSYAIYLNGRKVFKFGLIILPMAIFTALLNPLFNHQGGTILGYLPNGNPLTLESIAFGIGASTMLVTVITWFSCFNMVMSSDKFVYLFGRVIPSLSMILSMCLRFVPRFKDQIKIIYNAQRCIGKDLSNGNIIQKAKNGIKIISMMVTWSLENAIETADSMKARGYGLPGRTAFSIYNFDKRDTFAMVYMLTCIVLLTVGGLTGAYAFRYFPTIRGEWTGFWTISMFIVYFSLGVFPITLNLREGLVWKHIESKI